MKHIIQKIALYGDSLFKGVVLNSENRRYRISNNIGLDSIAKQYALDITNNSKFGYTIDRGFAILKRNLQNGAVYDAVLLEYGGNDCNFDWAMIADNPSASHLPNTPKAHFHQIYLEIIEYVRNKGIRPVLATLPPLCADRFFEWICRDGVDRKNVLTWLGDIHAIYRYQEMYSHEIERIAAETNTPILDIRGAFLEQQHLPDYMCEDGMHPNEQGQQLIRAAILQFLEQNRAILAPAYL